MHRILTRLAAALTALAVGVLAPMPAAAHSECAAVGHGCGTPAPGDCCCVGGTRDSTPAVPSLHRVGAPKPAALVAVGCAHVTEGTRPIRRADPSRGRRAPELPILYSNLRI